MKITAFQPKRKGEMTLYYMVRNGEDKAFINTGIKTFFPIIKIREMGVDFALNRKEPAMRAKMKRLEKLYWEIDEFIVSHPGMRPAAIKKVFCGEKSSSSVSALAQTLIEYADSGKVGKSTAAIMKRTAVKVQEFDPHAGFGIDEDWLDRFSAHLSDNGIKTNGIGLHLRNIRTAFNYARKKRMTKEYPFLDYQIKVERKPIRNMTAVQVREFKDYPCEAWQEEYRDIFMLSFCLAGINIGDLLQCRGLDNGRIIYTRAKTQKSISLPVFQEAQAIIDKYKGKDYLINPCDRYKDYHGYMHRMNDGLKKIGKTKIVPDKVGKLRKRETEPFFNGLSTYVARYSFASVAAECGVQRDVIAACLGHSWADVTSHYVAYMQKQIDDAIRKVLDYIYK